MHKIFSSVVTSRMSHHIDANKIQKFDPITTKFISKTMNNWKTLLYLNHQDGQIKTDHFSINTGIFQGNSSTGLLIILSLLPLSWLLNTSNIGYRINHRSDIISHLLFMDDLKLSTANDNQLASIIKIINKFSDDIEMSFGIDKCKMLNIQREKFFQMENIQLNNGEELKSLELNQQYKYLGFREGLTIDKTTKSALKNEYFKQLKMILKSELSSKYTFEAINLYAITALCCGFSVLDWTTTEFEIIDRETRKIMPCIAKVMWLDCISWEKMDEESLLKSPTAIRMQ